MTNAPTNASDCAFTAVHLDTYAPDWFAIERTIIEPAGACVRVQRCTTLDERVQAMEGAQAILHSFTRVDRELLEHLPDLEIIVRYGVGLDLIDIPACSDHNVLVAHFPDVSTPYVANHALTLLLAVARKLVPHHRSIRAGEYRGTPLPVSPPLTGETLGLISFGPIAREFAKRAQGIGMRVITYSPHVEDAVLARHGVERVASLDDLLREADHVSVHSPLGPETRHLISHREFALMKPHSIIVNTARGPIIDQEALVEALRSGQIGGAGLDVFEQEPTPASSPLFELDNVVLTPHLAFYTEASIRGVKEGAGHTVVEYMSGRWPTRPRMPNRDQIVPKRPLR